MLGYREGIATEHHNTDTHFSPLRFRLHWVLQVSQVSRHHQKFAINEVFFIKMVAVNRYSLGPCDHRSWSLLDHFFHFLSHLINLDMIHYTYQALQLEIISNGLSFR